MNGVYEFIMENTKTFKERSDLRAMDEREVMKLTESTVHYLTESMKSKSLNFDIVEDSKGNIQRIKGIENTIQSVNLIKDNYKGRSTNEGIVFTLSEAITNLSKCSDVFERAYKADHLYLKNYYNTLAYACIAGTSLIISGSVSLESFNKNAGGRIEIKPSSMSDLSSIEKLLAVFNASVKNGSFRKESKKYLETGRGGNNFIGTTTTMESIGSIAKMIAAGGLLLTTIVPLMRTVVYAFYYSRMKIADFLEQQALFIEANKTALEKDETMNPQAKQKIIEKQAKIIDKLRRLSDKIRVDYVVSSKKGTEEMKDDNKEWSFNNAQSKMNEDSMGDFELL